MKRTDLVDGMERGTTGRVINYAAAHGAHRPEFVAEYLAELQRLCLTHDFDFSILAAQSAHETADWTSTAWNVYGNPAGIGIMGVQGGPVGPNVSLVYKNGTDAARAHVVHFWVYSRGAIPQYHELEQWIPLDPRYDAALATFGNTIDTIDDFNVNGRWALVAAPPYYGDRIITKGNEIFGALEQKPSGGIPVPETITFGRVPKYGFTDKRAGVSDKPEGVGWDNLGQRKPKFIVLHRMIGSLDGTDQYFGSPSVPALTDFGVGVEAMDGKSRAGWIYMWSDPLGFRSGWASGRVSAPYGDGKRIVDKYGVIAVNRDGVSVEISGNQTTPIDPVSWQEIVHLCAWWADFMKIPYNSKINPATGINFLIWHEEFTIGTGKMCPFDVVKALTNRLYNDIAAFNKPHQTSGADPEPQPEPEPVPPAQYAAPVPVPELVEFSNYEADSMKAVVTTEGDQFIFVNDIVKATKDTPRYQRGKLDSDHIGPLIPKDTQFEVTWLFKSDDGNLYYISPYWSRVLVSDTERVSDAAG
jgi:hypothetical protein